MTVQKSMLEILNETIEYYEHNPRAVCNVTGGCQYYLPPDATNPERVCAVGRCLKRPGDFELVNCSATDLLLDACDQILKEEYQGHSRLFWDDLQFLHDTAMLWPRKQKEYVDQIIKKILDGYYEGN